MNRLAQSLSPYLLQHKDNPVDWFPWCDEAFELARGTDRPVFLSVGYAACHWCHVMEHESFENEEIAGFLNEHFVSIKVDREERPDVDQIYMNSVQVMTGHGGWPMSVFLNHDRQPFYAGTYWPAVPRMGMPSFPQVLEAIVDAWRNRRQDVEKHAGEITLALTQLADGTGERSESVPATEVIKPATNRLLRVLDRTDGGFGGAPKFPHATDLELLLRRGVTVPDSELVEAAEFTLDKMAAGGIRDHLGGGFARYSVDAQWLVPHFEKMLYDNALLAEVYARAFQVTGKRRHAEVAAETLDYICRDLVDPAGGFHCSEDADSEGEEGKFYVWTPQEVIETLGEERAERFCAIYDVTTKGNFEGRSILHLTRPLHEWAEQLSIPETQLREELAEERARLFADRENRVRPGKDDKVVTAWNALAIRALAVGGAVLDRPDLIDAAARAAEFIHARMRREDGRLLHAYRDGTAHIDAYVDDYAYLVDAVVALFETTGNPEWVQRATSLADDMLEHFEDKDNGGFFYSADDAELLIARHKDWHDGSLVSGNAAAAMAVLRLSRLCHRDDDRRSAERIFCAGADVMSKQAAACGALLSALDRYHHDSEQFVVAVSDRQELEQMRPVTWSRFRPHATLSWVIGDGADSGPLAVLNANKTPVRGEPTLYHCRDFTCEEPLVGQAASERLAGAV